MLLNVNGISISFHNMLFKIDLFLFHQNKE